MQLSSKTQVYLVAALIKSLKFSNCDDTFTSQLKTKTSRAQISHTFHDNHFLCLFKKKKFNAWCFSFFYHLFFTSPIFFTILLFLYYYFSLFFYFLYFTIFFLVEIFSKILIFNTKKFYFQRIWPIVFLVIRNKLINLTCKA